MTTYLNRFNILLAVTAVFLILFAVVAIAPVEAQTEGLFGECATAPADSELCNVVDNQDDDLVTGNDSLVVRIVNLIVFVSSAIAILMVVIGGLRYILSNGDPQGTQSAKNTILYAIIGLVVAIAARSIIVFILDRVL